MHSVFGKQSTSNGSTERQVCQAGANAAQDDRVFGTGSFSAQSRQSISRSSLNGFFRKRQAAVLNSLAPASSADSALIKIIGLRQPSATSRSRRSIPVIPGMSTSVMMHSESPTRSAPRYSSAEEKVTASYPNDRMRLFTASRTDRSSSIIEIMETYAEVPWSLKILTTVLMSGMSRVTKRLHRSP
jgi:hypothetical protein